MSRHTPGPWLWEKVEQAGTVTEHTLNGPDVLCRYWYDNQPSADARLIAAAPDLLEKGRRLYAAIYALRKDFDVKYPALAEAWTLMGEAIAKAEAQSE